jgi:hypothetical protein
MGSIDNTTIHNAYESVKADPWAKSCLTIPDQRTCARCVQETKSPTLNTIHWDLANAICRPPDSSLHTERRFCNMDEKNKIARCPQSISGSSETCVQECHKDFLPVCVGQQAFHRGINDVLPNYMKAIHRNCTGRLGSGIHDPFVWDPPVNPIPCNIARYRWDNGCGSLNSANFPDGVRCDDIYDNHSHKVCVSSNDPNDAMCYYPQHERCTGDGPPSSATVPRYCPDMIARTSSDQISTCQAMGGDYATANTCYESKNVRGSSISDQFKPQGETTCFGIGSGGYRFCNADVGTDNDPHNFGDGDKCVLKPGRKIQFDGTRNVYCDGNNHAAACAANFDPYAACAGMNVPFSADEATWATFFRRCPKKACDNSRQTWERVSDAEWAKFLRQCGHWGSYSRPI